MTNVVLSGEAPEWAHDLVRQLNIELSGVVLPAYSLSRLPVSAKPANRLVMLLAADGSRSPIYSDGAAWRFVSDNTEVP